MHYLETLNAFLATHWVEITGTFAAGILDIIFRLIPSNRFRSLLVYLAKLLGLLIILLQYFQKLVFFVTDSISKVVPDNRPPLPILPQEDKSGQ